MIAFQSSSLTLNEWGRGWWILSLLILLLVFTQFSFLHIFSHNSDYMGILVIKAMCLALKTLKLSIYQNIHPYHRVLEIGAECVLWKTCYKLWKIPCLLLIFQPLYFRWKVISWWWTCVRKRICLLIAFYVCIFRKYTCHTSEQCISLKQCFSIHEIRSYNDYLH